LRKELVRKKAGDKEGEAMTHTDAQTHTHITSTSSVVLGVARKGGQCVWRGKHVSSVDRDTVMLRVDILKTQPFCSIWYKHALFSFQFTFYLRL
jgi:hypothetical protein